MVFPPGYNVQQQVGTLPDPTDGEDGTLIYASGELEDPLRVLLVLRGRPAGSVRRDGGVLVGRWRRRSPVTVRAWSDDRGLGQRGPARS